jgi:hypothetical protein
MSNQTVISVQEFIEATRPQEVCLDKSKVIAVYKKLSWKYVPNSIFCPSHWKKLQCSGAGEYLILEDGLQFEYIKLKKILKSPIQQKLELEES